MYPAFDFFKQEPGDRYVWIGTAGSLSDAHRKIREVRKPQADFIIIDQQTGERKVIKAVDEPPHASAA